MLKTLSQKLLSQYSLFAVALSLRLASPVLAETPASATCSDLFDWHQAESDSLPIKRSLIANAHENYNNSHTELSMDVGRTEKSIGLMRFSIVRDNRQLVVNYVFTHPNFRGMGVAELLYQKILRDNPKIELISGSLADTNLMIYRSGLELGLTPLQAVQQTPAFKIRQRLGFSKIVDADILLPTLQELQDGREPLLITQH